jgi:hypothetical protein
MEVKPNPELLHLCKYWIPFLLKKHVRYGMWNKKELSIGSSNECMVAEAWGWSTAYIPECHDCKEFSLYLDDVSSMNRGANIRPTQVNRMIRKGNAFATHYLKKHGGSK